MNPLFKEIRSLSTERTNEATDRIDVMSTLEILQCINAEDAKVPAAVGEELTRIGEAVDLVVRAFTDG
ncbi:MAG: N-acetylmuramic acid 6-phosphate etherase, partial [Candidatus Kapaibacterium sp.]